MKPSIGFMRDVCLGCKLIAYAFSQYGRVVVTLVTTQIKGFSCIFMRSSFRLLVLRVLLHQLMFLSHSNKCSPMYLIWMSLHSKSRWYTGFFFTKFLLGGTFGDNFWSLSGMVSYGRTRIKDRVRWRDLEKMPPSLPPPPAKLANFWWCKHKTARAFWCSFELKSSQNWEKALAKKWGQRSVRRGMCTKIPMLLFF